MQNADAASEFFEAAPVSTDGYDLARRMKHVQDWIGNLGPDFDPDQRRMEALRQRLQANRFHLAVFG